MSGFSNNKKEREKNAVSEPGEPVGEVLPCRFDEILEGKGVLGSAAASHARQICSYSVAKFNNSNISIWFSGQVSIIL